jgi:hypothetical protein
MKAPGQLGCQGRVADQEVVGPAITHESDPRNPSAERRLCDDLARFLIIGHAGEGRRLDLLTRGRHGGNGHEDHPNAGAEERGSTGTRRW